ncbi:MAG: flagellar hook-length control protein FliK [Candidatus Sericytochromatia bacterium]|nr:flagellar hook-length control protein FliK [Candidatus Sericytochromatia bacterium]
MQLLPWLPPVGEFSAASEGGHVAGEVPRLVFGQLTQAIRNDQPVSHLDFHLDPPALGPVHLHVSYQQGLVEVQLTAQTLHAKLALEQQVGAIHQILTTSHFVPGPLKVVMARSATGGAGARQDPGSAPFQQGARRRRPSQGDQVVDLV